LGSANFRTRQRREKEAFRYEWDVGERGYYSSLHSSQVRTKKNGMGRKVMKSERNVRFFNRRFEGEWMVEKTIKFSSLTRKENSGVGPSPLSLFIPLLHP
jgi:hypothetical protein